MKARNALRWLAIAAGPMALVLGVASPAAAATAIGLKPDFYANNCDASVYIQDDLPGSSNRIEAWGGFSCSGIEWAGILRIKIWNGNREVAMDDKNSPGATTDHVETSIADPTGVQSFRATLDLFRPGYPPVIVSTGVIQS